MILGIVQARMGSTRLPGKVLKPILGRPLLSYMTERLQAAKRLDRFIIATGDTPENQPIIDFCKKNYIDYFAGSEEDVLDRYYQAAKRYNANTIVRMTGDCPLIDPTIVDKTIQFFLDNRFDYAGTGIEPTYPDGLNVEVFSMAALETSWREATRIPHREHVTLFIKDNPQRFRIGRAKNDIDLSSHRWCVDNPEDFEFITQIITHLYPHKRLFLMADVLDLLQQKPELQKINQHIARGEGLQNLFKKKN